MPLATQHIIIYFTCYFSFLVVEKASAKNHSHNLRAIFFQNGNMDVWQLKTIYALVILGSCTLYFLSAGSIDLLKNLSLQTENNMQNIGKMIIYIIAAILFTSKKNLHDHCQPSLSPVKRLFPYLALQTPFLVVYELFFRGVLLFGITEITGPVACIIVNSGLYMLLYNNEERKDMIRSVISDLILCIICLDMQSVLPAVIIKVITSLLQDIRLFRHSQLKSMV